MVDDDEDTTLTYVHQDSLNSTSLVTTDSGTLESTAAYLPFGGIRTGSVSTEQKFTGQRLDDTGLYYYNARYYDATIGRFISPDTIVQNPANPQTLNRYSYCLNNPLKYTDPVITFSGGGGTGAAATLSCSVSGVTVTAPGSGYLNPVVNIGGNATATANLSSGSVGSITITAPGGGPPFWRHRYNQVQ